MAAEWLLKVGQQDWFKHNRDITGLKWSQVRDHPASYKHELLTWGGFHTWWYLDDARRALNGESDDMLVYLHRALPEHLQNTALRNFSPEPVIADPVMNRLLEKFKENLRECVSGNIERWDDEALYKLLPQAHNVIIHKQRAVGICPDCLELRCECVEWYEKKGVHVMLPDAYRKLKRTKFDEAVYDRVIVKVQCEIENVLENLFKTDTFWED